MRCCREPCLRHQLWLPGRCGAVDAGGLEERKHNLLADSHMPRLPSAALLEMHRSAAFSQVSIRRSLHNLTRCPALVLCRRRLSGCPAPTTLSAGRATTPRQALCCVAGRSKGGLSASKPCISRWHAVNGQRLPPPPFTAPLWLWTAPATSSLHCCTPALP